MLHGARLVAFALVFVLLAVLVEGGEGDALGADDVAGVIGHGHAALAAHGHAFPLGDFQVDEHQAAVLRGIGGRLFQAGNVDDANALEPSHLRRGDAHPTGSGAHGLFQLGDEGTQLVIEGLHGNRLLFEALVRVCENFQNRHQPTMVSMGISFASTPSALTISSADCSASMPSRARPSMCMM